MSAWLNTRTLRRVAQLLIPLSVAGIAAGLIYRALQPFSADDIFATLRSIPADRIGLALGFTAASFVMLSASDTLAVRYTRRKLPFRKIALASFTAVSIGHLLGFAALSSGALRYRFYTTWGMTAGDVGRVLLFCGTTVVVGLLTVAGLAGLLEPDLLGQFFRTDAGLVRLTGGLALGTVGAYLAVAAARRRPLRLRRFELPMPGLTLAAGQVIVGAGDQLLVAAVLYQMLSTAASAPYVAVAAAYAAANGASAAAHVPGGLGVIEAVVLTFVQGAGAAVISALIGFRVIYYLLPFVLGCLSFAAAESWWRWRGRGGAAGRQASGESGAALSR